MSATTATAFVHKSVQCLSPAGLHSMSYKEWGDPGNPKVLVCVHGVTRVGDDFDDLAAALCDQYRVVCPDVVGRGRSDWLRNPMFYQVPQYASDMVTLLARLDAQTVHWFGTSMGALIGMGLAAMPQTPIGKFIINDVGPVLKFEALACIGAYIAEEVRFDSFEEGEAYMRRVLAPFGQHTDAQWRKLAADALVQDGVHWRRHYDPALAVPFQSGTVESAEQGEKLLWAAYDAIRCPTLLVRGAHSDLLSAETAAAMSQRGPRAHVVEIANAGHAPSFVDPAQIALARDFLLA
ncbi:MAG: alpha/beta fold hydrolase [Janthinobacterium lividum]